MKIKLAVFISFVMSLALIACSSAEKKSEAISKAFDAPAVKAAPTPAPVIKKEAYPAQESASEQTQAGVENTFICKGEDERKGEIQKNGAGCKMIYTKAGEAKAVATQNVGDQKCKEIFDRIKGKLTAAGYKCQ